MTNINNPGHSGAPGAKLPGTVDSTVTKPSEYPELPGPDGQSHLCGYFKTYCDQVEEDEGFENLENLGNVDKVDERDPEVVKKAGSKAWFRSQKLSGSLLRRLNSIQLVTVSHDNGSNVAEAHRSWFELSISRDKDEALNKLRWMSHENKFMTKEHIEEGDRIQVHAAADHEKSENHYKWGKLIYGIGCEDSEQSVEDKLLQWTSNNQEGALTFGDWSETPDEIETAINAKEIKFVLGRLKWSFTGNLVSLAQEANKEKKHVLLVFDADAEDLPEAAETDRRLSWGQTVENIWNVIQNPCKEIGDKSAGNNYFHLLIQIGFEGAIYKGFQAKGTKAHFIYEPTSAKGSFLNSYSDKDVVCSRFERGERENPRDRLRAYLSNAWMAGLISSLYEESAESFGCLQSTQIRDAMMNGIRWSRRLAAMGFPSFPDGAIESQPDFLRLMKSEIDSEPVLVSVELDLIVQGGDPVQTNFKRPLVLDSLPCSPQKAARDTLIQGFDCVLPYMPSARFGNLVTADRGEVEGFRKIARTVHEWYLTNTEPKPLSIAVFGQPGSGKSFGVKEVIKSILAADGKGITDLEYNLSQFRQEDDLRHAFEVIRGKTLSREMPVVFFDEFDSTFQGRELGWLPHFVKPITKGVYEDGEAERPLGRGIYIFIGGTKTKYEDFFEDLSDSSAPTEISEVTTETSREAFIELGDNAPVESPEKLIEAAEKALPDFLMKFLGLNLTPMILDISKMSQYDQLKKSFYKIRDKTLAKEIPLVFFREFDSNFGDEKLGWLKYFLAPMQDGEFFDHGSRHPLGRAIFVFEQGTEHFNGFPETDLNSSLFPGAKLPDFVSRLRGHVQIGNEPVKGRKESVGDQDEDQVGKIYEPLENVLAWYLSDDKVNKPLSIGLFRECQQLPDAGLRAKETFKTILKGYVNVLGPSILLNKTGAEEEDDRDYFPIRRAILLRSMLERNFKFARGEPISMNDRVLNALLFTPTVLHGARSLESILSMSKINAGKPIEVNDICKEDQRKLHVKDPRFEQYLNGKINPPNAERDEQHYAWIERKSGRAYKPRPVVQSDPTATSAVSGSASG
ncbi:hypothetical protein AnigIFM56816_000462 [Aspergillus niger]|nr:hypothetical protein AnigIFM56816_000462 [Aspergillus niger]